MGFFTDHLQNSLLVLQGLANKTTHKSGKSKAPSLWKLGETSPFTFSFRSKIRRDSLRTNSPHRFRPLLGFSYFSSSDWESEDMSWPSDMHRGVLVNLLQTDRCQKSGHLILKYLPRKGALESAISFFSFLPFSFNINTDHVKSHFAL